MATMVKEKRREKKKIKEKNYKPVSVCEVPCSTSHLEPTFDDEISHRAKSTTVSESTTDLKIETTQRTEVQEYTEGIVVETSQTIRVEETISVNSDTISIEIQNTENNNAHLQLSQELDKVYLSDVSLGSEANEFIQDSEVLHSQVHIESTVPSAPLLEYEEPQILPALEIPIVNEVIRLKSMPLDEAAKLFGGSEIADVLAISEREEAIVEAGPTTGAEHPLVDLLSTFRRSLIAVERERTQMEIGYAEEEKFRLTLWKVTKKTLQATEKCPCGNTVYFKATYEHAEFQKDRLPIARMKLAGLLKDVQESFCHNQHEALLAHYQIEEFISEVVKSHKGEIREALTLVLQALKRCDDAPAVLAIALERWARELAAALVDQRDLRQLLFLIHHLFRQTRSVRWAARIINVTVIDRVSAARAIALLDLLLARAKIDAAIECVEDREEAWEEVDKDGGGGAVTDGRLRERDLLAILVALPVRDLLATMLRLRPVVGQKRVYQWDDTDASAVIRACSGTRVLLHTLERATVTHARYTRLQRALRDIARNAMNALAALHEHARSSYTPEMEMKVLGELQAVFLSGLRVCGELHEVPASLLAAHAARECCLVNMRAVEVHDDSVVRVESLSLELPRARCIERVRFVARAATCRRHDYELARTVLEFLFQVGVRRSTSTANASCKGECRLAARESLREVVTAHPYLHALALHLVAETYPVEKLDAASIEWLRIGQWRPQSGEIRGVLDAWARCCPGLLPALLMQTDCAPDRGLSLESQLTIGAWLCEYVSLKAEPEDWCWRSLRRLRLHQVYWGLSVEAPPPDPRPPDLFGQAFALMASSWGHSIPFICSEGVEALCALAASRVQDALHCLAPIMLVLAHSPESVSTTTRFRDLFSMLINAGPGLVRRALGRGGDSGADCVLRLVMEQLKHSHCGGVPRDALAAVWTAALWPVAGANALLDAALLVSARATPHRHAACLAQAQDEESQQQLAAATKWYAQAPLLCESALRAWHNERELRTHLYPRLLDALHAQRARAARIHVDNALESIGASIKSDQLTVYNAAAAAQAAPPAPPALCVWRLLMHLYLQRPPASPVESTPPVGLLFFSGLIKSRTLTQLKRRLLKVIQHHAQEATALKAKQNKTERQTTSRSSSKTVIVPNDLAEPLSIRDLTGESSETSDADTDTSEEQMEESDWEDGIAESNEALLLAYHIGAERMFCEYLRWLDEGEKTKAMPHHAEIANFIPEQALQAAFECESRRRYPSLSPDADPIPLPPMMAPPPPPDPPTPLHDATQALNSIKGASKRRARTSFRSPLKDVDFREPRALLSLIDKHLTDIQILSQEWCKEVGRVVALDTAVWDLVSGLRVAKPVGVLRAACANKCPPVTHAAQAQQWCISSSAEQGIKENRGSARAAVRKLARARPHAAKAAAVLLAIARRTDNAATARRATERVLRCAGAVSGECAPAAAAFAAILDLIAERWLSTDGAWCVELVSQFCGDRSTALQRALCVSAVGAARGVGQYLPALHAALLASKLPAAQAFSAVSKLDVSRWSQSVEGRERAAMLELLVAAAQRWGPTPTDDDMLMVELLGVQMASVCHTTELCVLLRACARACVNNALPPPILQHVLRAVDKCAADLPFDQLGHVLRELGVTWWEARTKLAESSAGCYDAYTQHTLELLLALHRAFYHAAVALSYAMEKVGTLTWASFHEAFAAWAVPAAPPTLPAPLHNQYDGVLKLVMGHLLLYNGIEPILLNQIFEWVIQTYQASQGSRGRLQVSVLLSSCGDLPWTGHQWLQPSGLQALLQVSQCNDEEMLSWCGRCTSWLRGEAWLRGAGAPGGRLAALLYLWTGTMVPCAQQIVDCACTLPWQQLPEAAADEALERFFQINHGITSPFHRLPQFKILLAACELIPLAGVVSTSVVSREKRARGVSQWTRALHAHAQPASDARALANVITGLAPHLTSADVTEGGVEGELVELVGRALILFCIEPAATAALPVWEAVISSSDAAMLRTILQAVGGLTAFEYFAPLADIAVATYLAKGGDWPSVVQLWRNCVWDDPSGLCARGRLYAAYATHATVLGYAGVRAALLALLATDIDFKKSEAIVAVWICVACRVARCCSKESEEAECGGAALGLLSRWGDAPRGLMRLVMASAAGPTSQHRLLCLLAQCVLDPSNDAARAYESLCPAVLGSSPDVATWARSPHPKRLPRLATRLFPNQDKYFQFELDLAPEDY